MKKLPENRKQQKQPIPSHSPNYVYILPPGELIEEKISEMGIDVSELVTRMEVPVEIVERLPGAPRSLTWLFSSESVENRAF